MGRNWGLVIAISELSCGSRLGASDQGKLTSLGTHPDDNLEWADCVLLMNLAPARPHDPVLQDYFEESQSCSIGNFSINYHISISFY